MPAVRMHDGCVPSQSQLDTDGRGLPQLEGTNGRVYSYIQPCYQHPTILLKVSGVSQAVP